MIYLERTISVNRGSASIDEPVILYKGDKNVEIQFSIKNNPFRCKSGAGVTFGQLIINRENADSIFSSVARLSSSKVLFVITRDMIDELNECGNYDFQIRLFNEDQSSRATLPPINGGIIIREPICEGDVADSGSTDGSTSTDGEEIEIFDEEGNYNKTTWESGDLITTQNLNKVEDAIDYLVDESKTHVTEEELNTALQNVEVDLSGYATKTELNTKADTTHAHDEYITEYELEAKGYLTEHQSLEGYALKTEIPSVEGLATEDYVTNAINTIELTPGPKGDTGEQGPQGQSVTIVVMTQEEYDALEVKDDNTFYAIKES